MRAQGGRFPWIDGWVGRGRVGTTLGRDNANARVERFVLEVEVDMDMNMEEDEGRYAGGRHGRPGHWYFSC